MGIFAVYGLQVYTVIVCALFSILIVIAIIDYRHYVIPNGLVIAMIILGLFQLVLDYRHWYNYIIGFFAVSTTLMLIAIITKGKMGGGDIKLMAAAGLFLGWQKVILALIMGSFYGSIIGVTLILSKRIKRGQPIPFGPFLTMGILTSTLIGDKLISWYVSLII